MDIGYAEVVAMGWEDAEGYVVEHRKFGKLLDQLKELTAAQAEKVVAALRRGSDGDAVCQIIEQRVSEAPKCPRCGAAHIRRYGVEHGLQRYRCVGCGRTFNALTGTPLARLRKKECWASFANSLQQSHSVRGAPGWGRQEHLFPLAPPFSAPGQRRTEINAAVSRFKNWLTRFNGVASKYLPNYLAWRRRQETGKIPFAAMPC